MKTLFRLIRLYLASNCFRKLLEEKEISPEELKTMVKGNEIYYESSFTETQFKENGNGRKFFITDFEKNDGFFSFIVNGTHKLRLKKFLLGKGMYLYILRTSKKLGENVFFEATIKWYDDK